MSLGMWGVCSGISDISAVFSKQFRTGAIKQLFEAAPVADGFAEGRDHGMGHVHGSAAALGTPGEQPSRVFVAALTGPAVFADAGFIDLGQRAFDGRPEGGGLLLPLLFGL